MKVSVCQLDNRPGSLDPMLDALAAHIAAEDSQLLLLPEMCFAEWLAADPEPGTGEQTDPVDEEKPEQDEEDEDPDLDGLFVSLLKDS